MMTDLKIAAKNVDALTEEKAQEVIDELSKARLVVGTVTEVLGRDENGNQIVSMLYHAPNFPTKSLTRWQRTKRWFQKRLGVQESVYLKDTDGRLW